MLLSRWGPGISRWSPGLECQGIYKNSTIEAVCPLYHEILHQKRPLGRDDEARWKVWMEDGSAWARSRECEKPLLYNSIIYSRIQNATNDIIGKFRKLTDVGYMIVYLIRHTLKNKLPRMWLYSHLLKFSSASSRYWSWVSFASSRCWSWVSGLRNSFPCTP